eukprot:TRINITY_DN14739_c0_g1_i1.p1 TRINITY_DN14739_c0_g1~~TRINITY_DN14739_c0_g1_i1.p1  ORF type:complete len:383 (+),score=61.52 TRINITY_DN14739_c0_g1_i1:90-1238(+)
MVSSQSNSTSVPTGTERYMGVTMEQFVSICWERDSKMMAWMNGSAVIGLSLIVVLLCRHLASFSGAGPSLRRAQYTTIAWLPTVFALTATIPLFSPSSVMVSAFVQKIYEAYCLYTFGLLMFILLTHEAQESARRSAAAEVEAGMHEFESSEGLCVQDVVQALALQGPKKHFATPPLCCCCGPLMSPFDMSASHLQGLFWMLRQYVFCICLVGLASLYSSTAFSFDRFERITLILKYPMVLSSLICLYSLFVLYMSTRGLLKSWNTTKKFASIKIILIIMMYQDWILERFSKGIFSHLDSCFKHVGYTHYDWQYLEAKRWGCWLVVLEMLPMALMIKAAFTADDLEVTIQETHQDILRIALHEHKTGSTSGNDSMDSTGSSD